MSAPSQSEHTPRAPFLSTLAVYLRPGVLVVMLLGFSSGLPLALTGETLRVWMADRGVDLGTIGLLALAGLPYTLKFLWAPVVDAWQVPYLSRRLGRRRGWLVASQLVLMATIVFLGTRDPLSAPLMVGLAAVLVAFASATQDIVVDAFRVQSLPTDEQAAGMASYVAAYRIGMLASGAGVIGFSAWLEAQGLSKEAIWPIAYMVAALLVLVGLAAALLAREPERVGEAHPEGTGALARLFDTAKGAFSEFLLRDGRGRWLHCGLRRRPLQGHARAARRRQEDRSRRVGQGREHPAESQIHLILRRHGRRRAGCDEISAPIPHSFDGSPPCPPRSTSRRNPTLKSPRPPSRAASPTWRRKSSASRSRIWSRTATTRPRCRWTTSRRYGKKDGKLILVTAITPDAGGRGQDHDDRRPGRCAEPHRQEGDDARSASRRSARASA